MLAPILSAVAGAAARRAQGFDFWPSMGQWFLGDALTNLAITPTLFLWFSKEYRRLRGRLLETTLWTMGFAVCLLYILRLIHASNPPIVLYAPLPFLIWGAARLGTVAASSALSVMALFLMLVAAQNVHFVQLFLGTVCLPILFVAVLLEERRTIERRLRESQEQLNMDYSRVNDLARKLIGAPEDERREITRQLHEDVSQPLAALISNLQREREQQTAAELEDMLQLQEVGMRCLQTGHDFKGSLYAILDAAISLTKAAKGNIHLLDASSDTLTLAVQQGFEASFLDFFAIQSHQASPCKTAVNTRERVVVENVLESRMLAGTPAVEVLLDAGVHAVQSTPLISSSNKLLGVICTHYLAPYQPRERELRLMDLLARQAADYLERKQTEEALAASSAELRRFLEAAPSGLTRCSRDLRYLSANSAYGEIAGLPVKEIVGRRIIDVMGVNGWEAIEPYVERVLQGERVEYETLLPYAAAGPRHVHVVYTPENNGGEVTGWVAAITDIADFKRVEKQLQEVERIAAAGQLAASLAHEINNPLSAVINVLYLLAGRTDLDPTCSGLIAIANNEITRVSRIVKQSLSYYRVDVVAREVDLSALIEESLQVFNDKFQHGGITVIKKIATGTRIVGFPDEIRQVVDNLLVNAVEATPFSGCLALCLRQSRSWKIRGEPGARLTIADNGCGIPKAYLARVFEPFFTTKAEKGTGLGLWVVKGIVEKHGGSIKLRSTDAVARRGTSVCIFWPSAAATRPTSKLLRSEHAA
jgi:PAS domain S-box-containing protein